MDNVILLDDWFFAAYGDEYTAPECWEVRLWGICFGHPYFEDGGSICPSKVVSVDVENKTFTTYSGKVYRLGKVNAGYLLKYPNAEVGIWEHLEKRSKMI